MPLATVSLVVVVVVVVVPSTVYEVSRPDPQPFGDMRHIGYGHCESAHPQRALSEDPEHIAVAIHLARFVQLQCQCQICDSAVRVVDMCVCVRCMRKERHRDR